LPNPSTNAAAGKGGECCIAYAAALALALRPGRRAVEAVAAGRLGVVSAVHLQACLQLLDTPGLSLDGALELEDDVHNLVGIGPHGVLEVDALLAILAVLHGARCLAVFIGERQARKIF